MFTKFAKETNLWQSFLFPLEKKPCQSTLPWGLKQAQVSNVSILALGGLSRMCLAAVQPPSRAWRGITKEEILFGMT